MKNGLISLGRWKLFVIGFGGFLSLLIVFCWFLRIHRPADFEKYNAMREECHPIWKEFAFRRYGAGDSNSELFRRYPPNRSEEFGRYGIYTFYRNQGNAGDLQFTGFTITTREGKILAATAWSCTWQFVFFQTKDNDFDREYRSFWEAKLEKLRHKSLEDFKLSLLSFYRKNARWPTNAVEFADYIYPPFQSGQSMNSFHAGKIHPMKIGRNNEPNRINDIVLVPQSDGGITIGITELPETRLFVSIPELTNTMSNFKEPPPSLSTGLPPEK